MLFPNQVFAAAVESVNESAGVVVGVATAVVNNGDKVPALKDVTVPVPPDDHAGIPATTVSCWPGVPIGNFERVLTPEAYRISPVA